MSTGGGGRDDRGGKVEELVGLHDDRVAGAPLLAAARGPRCRKPKHLAADHRYSGAGASSADAL